MSCCASKSYSLTTEGTNASIKTTQTGSSVNASEDKPRPSCWHWFIKPNERNEEVIEVAEFDRKKSLKQSLLSFSIASPTKKKDNGDNHIQIRQHAEKMPILSVPATDADAVGIKSEMPHVEYFIREEDGWTDNLSVVEMHEWSPSSSVSLQLVNSEDITKKGDKADEGGSWDTFGPVAFSPEGLKNNVFRQNYTELSTPKDPPQKAGEATGCTCEGLNSTPSTIDLSNFFEDITFEEDKLFDVQSFTSSWGEEIGDTDASVQSDITNDFGWDDAAELDFSEAPVKDPVGDKDSSTRTIKFDGFQLVITHLSGDNGEI